MSILSKNYLAMVQPHNTRMSGKRRKKEVASRTPSTHISDGVTTETSSSIVQVAGNQEGDDHWSSTLLLTEERQLRIILPDRCLIVKPMYHGHVTAAKIQPTLLVGTHHISLDETRKQGRKGLLATAKAMIYMFVMRRISGGDGSECVLACDGSQSLGMGNSDDDDVNPLQHPPKQQKTRI